MTNEHGIFISDKQKNLPTANSWSCFSVVLFRSFFYITNFQLAEIQVFEKCCLYPHFREANPILLYNKFSTY